MRASGPRGVTRAFLYAAPIGALGGLIGLGGAEFRLPVLVGALGYGARQAVPLNLAISLVTLTAAVLIRTRVLSLELVRPLAPVMLIMTAAAVVSATLGAALAASLSRERLERLILVLLVGIGSLLIIEGLLPQALPPLITGTAFLQALAAVPLGVGIGAVSSALGVAGGELIIPALVFIYGADIKTAGTASLLISLPVVSVGILRYHSLGGYRNRDALVQTVIPMGLGSLIGATLGGMMTGLVNASVIKISLGLILNISAYRIFGRLRPARLRTLR